MFNLNDTNFGGGSTVFNNGNAGKVKNVKMEVTKKSSDDNSPDYKLVFTDVAGGQINTGFYYPANNEMKSKEDNEKMEQWQVSRVLSAARSVVSSDFVFPDVATAKEAFDSLFKIIKDNSENKMVNLYVTYGTSQKPSQYLGTRFFNYIEAAETNDDLSKLKFSANDMMTKLVADAPQGDAVAQAPTTTATSGIW